MSLEFKCTKCNGRGFNMVGKEKPRYWWVTGGQFDYHEEECSACKGTGKMSYKMTTEDFNK